MDIEKIGAFIRKLRTDKGLSQYELADMIPIDRSVVSKWERGEASPPTDKIKILCDIFNISLDELISGELKTKENEKQHEINLFNYLLSQDSKNRKLKITSIILLIIIFILTFLFLAYYFLETHNTEKIYRIYGESDNYILRDGILVLTRENSYLKIGSIDNKDTYETSVYDIKIYYKKDNKNEEIYNGSSDLILKDLYEYDAVLNNSNFDDIKNNLYLEINGEEIKLELSTDYNNDSYILNDWDYVNDKSTNLNKLNVDIGKIKKEFKCEETFCEKYLDHLKIKYVFLNSTLYITDKSIKIQYDIIQNKFSYESKKLNFDIINNQLNCKLGSCENYKEIYDKYYTNIIKNYLK